MLLKFLKRATPPRSAPTIPPGQRVYAIGDIHGRLDLLDPLLDVIDADDTARGPARTTYVFLGDLVGQIFTMVILTVAAAEASIGLAILVVYFRNRATIDVEDIRQMKG